LNTGKIGSVCYVTKRRTKKNR